MYPIRLSAVVSRAKTKEQEASKSCGLRLGDRV